MSRKDGVCHRFGPGKYFVGDICYAIDDVIYHDLWGRENNYKDGVFKVNDVSFAVASTAFGDGGYVGSDGVKYSVDAGVIGVVPDSLWKKDAIPTGGRIVVAKTSVTFSTFDGRFTITVDEEVIEINTQDDDFEEEGI